MPRRPADLDLLDAVDLEPEVDAGVGGRLVAPAAVPPGAVPTPPAVIVTTAPTASRLDRVPSSWNVAKWPPGVWLWR